MNKEWVKAIFEYWEGSYYVEPLAGICQCIALVTGIRYVRKRKESLYFLIYIGTWLIDFTATVFISRYFRAIKNQINVSDFITETSGAIASMIEFACFCCFFYKVLKFPQKRNLLKILTVIFAFPVTLFFIKLHSAVSVAEITHFSFLVSSISLCLLLIPCMLYYYGLFRKDITEGLLKKPAFLIITSFLFYCVIAIPFFLLVEELLEVNKTILKFCFAIHIGSFCLLFLTISREFTMNRSLTE